MSLLARCAASFAVVAGLLACSADASAFCRTMTARSAADYDATQKGCFNGPDPNGRPVLPLFWRNACIGYNVRFPTGRRVSYDDASSALQTAFTVWTGATCPTEGEGRSRASIDVRDLGPVVCDAVQYKGRAPNQNVVLFRDDVWPYPPEVLGLTTVVFAPETGEIFGADMEINTKDMDKIAFDPTVEVKKDEYDFLSVVTHEAGHFLGIAHSDVPGATMFARYNRGETHQRILTSDDVNAVCAIYRPDGTRAVLGDKVYVAPGCDPTPRGGFTTQCEDAPSATICSVSAPGRSLSSPIGWLVAAGVAAFGVRRAVRCSRSKPAEP